MPIPKGQNATLVALYEKAKSLGLEHGHFFLFLKKIIEDKVKNHGILSRPTIAIKFFEHKGSYYIGLFRKNRLISTTRSHKDDSYTLLTSNIVRAAEMMDLGCEFGSIEIEFDFKLFIKIQEWYKSELIEWLIDGIDVTISSIDKETKIEIVEAAKI